MTRGQASFELMIIILLVVLSLPFIQAVSDSLADTQNRLSMQQQARQQAQFIRAQLAMVAIHSTDDAYQLAIKTQPLVSLAPLQEDDCRIELDPVAGQITIDYTGQIAEATEKFDFEITIPAVLASETDFIYSTTSLRCGETLEVTLP